MPCIKDQKHNTELSDKNKFVNESDLNLLDLNPREDDQVEVESLLNDVNVPDEEENVPLDQVIPENPLHNYQLTKDRERKEIRPLIRFDQADFAFVYNVQDFLGNEPSSFEEVMESKDANLWFVAMREEMNSLLKNKTWVLVNKPKGQKLNGCK
ncbi:Retrovirus-related Pol polyprotein from transposon TNT 1-94 [Abeliophyllum distichum]|uniref:Retrovirus-related Pol polyprotein from transposon TNT 1-94 n=1 Tax=Abeliophyllum distichum TaxID=126358 RepID=A0ABD1NVH5_9LAMI